MTSKTLTIGLLQQFMDNYFKDTLVAVRVPGSGVYAVTGVTLRSINAELPIVFELLTEKDFDLKKIEPIKLADDQSISRDFYQP